MRGFHPAFFLVGIARPPRPAPGSLLPRCLLAGFPPTLSFVRGWSPTVARPGWSPAKGSTRSGSAPPWLFFSSFRSCYCLVRLPEMDQQAAAAVAVVSRWFAATRTPPSGGYAAPHCLALVASAIRVRNAPARGGRGGAEGEGMGEVQRGVTKTGEAGRGGIRPVVHPPPPPRAATPSPFPAAWPGHRPTAAAVGGESRNRRDPLSGSTRKAGTRG